MTINYIQGIKRPEFYQGTGRERHRYFEGWYFKHDIPQDGVSYAFIPGISFAGTTDSHSFIQVIRSSAADGSHLTRYIRYPVEKFEASARSLSIKVGDSIFTHEGCALDVRDPSDAWRLTGNIMYGPLTAIKKSAFAPGIMGPFAYVPGMECSHGVISLEHTLSGSIDENGETRDFGGGTGYIEKDWGTSFPRAYIWLQAPGFMLSVASIPFTGFVFNGFLCLLLAAGCEHRFTTYDFSHIAEMSLQGGTARIRIKKPGRWELDVEAVQTSQGGSIIAPQKGRMDRLIKECLAARISLRLTRKGAAVYEKTFHQASMEIVGKTQ